MKVIPALAVLMVLVTACGTRNVDVNDPKLIHRQDVTVNGHVCTAFLTSNGGISVVCP